VEASIRRFGDRYLARVYTPQELAFASTATRLASTFAAKEATLKVLRPVTRWMDWRSIEVLRAPAGWPEVVLHGEALALARIARIEELAVTMTHEADFAGAVVVATIRFPDSVS
jgi:holo-[acyl-carrier protein] synthase